MTRPFSRLLLLSSITFAIVACGAAATLPPEESSGDLAGHLLEAVWYAENGDHSDLAVPSNRSVLVIPPGDGSTYVNGAFSIDVPDAERILFLADVSIATGEGGPLLFRAYAQDGDQFPMLAEVLVEAVDQSQPFQFDLSRFRGRSLLLILAISSADEVPLRSSARWENPQIVTP